MAVSTSSQLLDTALAYRDDLERATVQASTDAAQAWLVAQERINLEVQALLSKMDAARLAGIDPSPAWLYQERRLSGLLETIQEQAARWAATAEPGIRELAYEAAQAASENARTLATEAARIDLPGVEAAFTDLNPENMATILGHLAPGGPLRDLLVSLGAETALAAQEALLTGVILGKGTDWIARELGRSLDIPRWRAETIARTESLRAYRETSRETYKRSNVVAQWEWTAALDRRTCPACLGLHGRRFSVEEQLDGHPRCRCAMVPVTKTWAEMGLDPSLDDMNPRTPTVTGEDWLKSQSPLTQKAILGPGKYDLYANGKAGLPDFIARTRSDAWGTMRRERSLRELAEGRNPDHRDVTPDAPTVPRTDAPFTITGSGTKADPYVATVQPDVFRDAVKPTQHLPSVAEAKALGLPDDMENTWDALLAYVDTSGIRERVDYWRAQIRAGADVPPVRLYDPFGPPRTTAQVEDGHHRAAAFLLEGLAVPIRHGSGVMPEFLVRWLAGNR